MGRTPAEGGGKVAGGRVGNRAGSRVGSRHLSSRGAGVGLSSATASLCTSDDKTRSISRSLPIANKASQPMASLEDGGNARPPLDFMKSLFKPYKVSERACMRSFIIPHSAVFKVAFLSYSCTEWTTGLVVASVRYT